MVKLISDFPEIPVVGSVVIDFFATWCGPCKRIAPVFDQLAEKNPSISFLKVDVDESAELVDFFGVNAMPTFVFIKDAKVVKRVEGADLAELEAGFALLQ